MYFACIGVHTFVLQMFIILWNHWNRFHKLHCLNSKDGQIALLNLRGKKGSLYLNPVKKISSLFLKNTDAVFLKLKSYYIIFQNSCPLEFYGPNQECRARKGGRRPYGLNILPQHLQVFLCLISKNESFLLYFRRAQVCLNFEN